ncbi:MAG: alkaline phosphatase family protein [Planctomycetota bacterium]|nr:alkaline phosphatase family protein [Planctomycetota bacterium]
MFCFSVQGSRVCFLALLLCGGVGVPAEADSLAEHVVIISVDGLRPDAIDRTEAPILDRWRKRGAMATEARTIFPSITLPSHTSMLTGLRPIRHRVLFNSKKTGMEYIRSTTCLEIAAQAGRRVGFVVAKEKLLHLSRSVPEPSLVSTDAAALARETCRLLRERKPNLLFVHFRDPDSTGHRHGWMSPEQLLAIARVDRGLGTIEKTMKEIGIWDRSVLILTADHGGHGLGHGSFMDVDMLIPWICVGGPIQSGQRIKRSVQTFDTAATALFLLGLPVPSGWDGKPVTELAIRGSAGKK